MPENDYPPECVENSFASFAGELNGFAGLSDSGERSVSGGAEKSVAGFSAALGNIVPPIPVVLTGSRGPHTDPIPGLRDAMIASAIIRMASLLPKASGDHADELRAAALKLLQTGGQKIVDYSRNGGRPKKKGR